MTDVNGSGPLPWQTWAKAAAVTASADTDLPNVSGALYCGATGDVSVLMVGATVPITFKAVPAGTILPVRAQRVTAGSQVVALW